MNSKFATAMREAAAATLGLDVLGATRTIQRALGKTAMPSVARDQDVCPDVPAKQHPADGSRELANTPPAAMDAGCAPAKAMASSTHRASAQPKNRWPLGQVVESLRKLRLAVPQPLQAQPFAMPGKTLPTSEICPGAFVTRSFACGAGARNFKLYVPASSPARPKGLVVMLHGCTQDPDDFAAGTNMNMIAERHGFLVAYPAQTHAGNASSCWNWFEKGHQARDGGEPAIIAGLARQLIAELDLDRSQIHVAGLSAGAAMAVIMGETYPDIFSAVGVHSGLAYQSAGNVMSALAAMRGNGGPRLGQSMAAPRQETMRHGGPVRMIIFHGSEDRTVAPSNALRILDAAAGAVTERGERTVSGTANGLSYTQTVIENGNGEARVESWLIQGAGHAWSGGKASGSYTETRGPDASEEMMRFFLSAN